MASQSSNVTDKVNVSDSVSSSVSSGLISRWGTVIGTCNCPEGITEPDFISKWLIIIRACVFSMTIMSGMLGGILAIWTAFSQGLDLSISINWVNFFLGTLAIVLAHAVNNMLNDWFDLKTGVDDNEYTRALYAPHPILSGYTTKKGLLGTVALFNIIFLLITLYFAITVDPLVMVFAILGMFLSIAYVAPPFKFKHRGLGEPSVFIIWGPLMIGIIYYVTLGSIDEFVIWASLPYAITVTTVLMGKHIDKLALDKEKGVKTLPVMIGENKAKILNQILMILFYVLIIGMVLADLFGIGVLIVFLAIPRLITVIKFHNQPKPLSPPDNWSVWPLWLVGWSFWHNKMSGGLFILGLIINFFIPANFLYFSSIISVF